jgi:hypothetical protein
MCVDECALALLNALALPAAIPGNSCDTKDQIREAVWHDRIPSINAMTGRLAKAGPNECDFPHIPRKKNAVIW